MTEIDIDVAIDQTTKKLVDTLRASGLSVGIMMLILGDIMHSMMLEKMAPPEKREKDGTD